MQAQCLSEPGNLSAHSSAVAIKARKPDVCKSSFQGNTGKLLLLFWETRQKVEEVFTGFFSVWGGSQPDPRFLLIQKPGPQADKALSGRVVGDGCFCLLPLQ